MKRLIDLVGRLSVVATAVLIGSQASAQTGHLSPNSAAAITTQTWTIPPDAGLQTPIQEVAQESDPVAEVAIGADPCSAACQVGGGCNSLGCNPGGLIGHLLYGYCCDEQAADENICGEAECPDCKCRWCVCGTLEAEPWQLPVPCQLEQLGIDWGGWLSTGIYANAHGADDNGPLGFRDSNDGWSFDQWYFYAERNPDTSRQWIDWGFRVDLVFGVDGPDTQAFGGHPDSFDNPWDTGGDYGFAMPQLYAQVAFGDLNVKLGHFYTIIGYEVVTIPDNFFYSHTYTMFWGEPFTHTGVLAEYPLGRYITLYGGWTQGWDTGFDNTPGANTFLGGVSLELTKWMSLTYATSFGDFGSNLEAGDIYMHSLVLQWQLSEKLTYVLQHDLGVNTLAGEDAEWYGLNQYFLYQLNDCWAAGLRVEWFRDDDAARISWNGPAAGNYWEVTWGLNWKPHSNVVIRPEIRYDWFDGVAAGGDLPFDEGHASDQLAGGVDLIVTY